MKSLNLATFRPRKGKFGFFTKFIKFRKKDKNYSLLVICSAVERAVTKIIEKLDFS